MISGDRKLVMSFFLSRFVVTSKIFISPLKMTLHTGTLKHRLVLKDYEDIINASKTFAAETTQIIVIEEKDEKVDDIRKEHKFRAITSILRECSKHRMLEAFKWHTGPADSNSTRPAEFWEALTSVGPNLQHLSFNFYTHELHRIKETGISVRAGCYSHPLLLVLTQVFFQAKFPSTFPLLKSLYLGCSGAHGDDGSPIEKLLHGLPSLRVLYIDAPICDLESCRMQELTWSYKFPQLTHFAISIFYSSAQDIASFLANHPNIRTLMFDAEGEEPIPNVTSLLPNLEALSNDGWRQTTSAGYTELLIANPPRKITYFKPGTFPYDQYHLIPQYAPSLRCLELSLDIENIRNEHSIENAQYRTIKALLALLPDLSELAIHFCSDWTTILEDSETGRTRRTPLPMDEEILSKIIRALPESSNLQVLRMKDHDGGKGLPLAVQSSTFASLREIMPSSIKVLQWELENSTVRYELESGQSVGIVDPSEQHQWPDRLLWTDASILKHLRD